MSDERDKSPWYGTAEDGLRWILRDETCKTEQIELVAEKALEKIEALLSLSADKDREIESLQRERDEARANYTRDVPEFTKRIESLQRENEELKGQLQTLEYLEAERIEHADKLPSCPQCKSSDSVCHPSLMRSMIAAKEGFVCQEYGCGSFYVSEAAITPEMRERGLAPLKVFDERNRFSVEDEMAEWIRDLLGEQGCVF